MFRTKPRKHCFLLRFMVVIYELNDKIKNIGTRTPTMSFVSSDDIQRARRIALRGRSALACIPCKDAKSKCNDYRPCARCKKLSQEPHCIDSVLYQPQANDRNPHDNRISAMFHRIDALISNKKCMSLSLTFG